MKYSLGHNELKAKDTHTQTSSLKGVKWQVYESCAPKIKSKRRKKDRGNPGDHICCHGDKDVKQRAGCFTTSFPGERGPWKRGETEQITVHYPC